VEKSSLGRAVFSVSYRTIISGWISADLVKAPDAVAHMEKATATMPALTYSKSYG
jgi:hypothetical protein